MTVVTEVTEVTEVTVVTVVTVVAIVTVVTVVTMVTVMTEMKHSVFLSGQLVSASSVLELEVKQNVFWPYLYLYVTFSSRNVTL